MERPAKPKVYLWMGLYVAAGLCATAGGCLLLLLSTARFMGEIDPGQLGGWWATAWGALAPWTLLAALRAAGRVDFIDETPRAYGRAVRPLEGVPLALGADDGGLRPAGSAEQRAAAAHLRRRLREGPLFYTGLLALAAAAPLRWFSGGGGRAWLLAAVCGACALAAALVLQSRRLTLERARPKE